LIFRTARVQTLYVMPRSPFRDGTVWAYLVGAAFFAFLCLLAVKLCGCAGAEKTVDAARAEACWERMSAAIQRGRTCPEAVAGVAQVVKEEPACAVVSRSITLVCHDGGASD